MNDEPTMHEARDEGALHGGARAWQTVPTGAAATPAGAYSPAVMAGGFIFVSGQVPRAADTGQIVGADVAAQTRQVFANVERVLHAAGATLDDVVSVTAYLADIGDWAAFDAAYRTVFTLPYPTRTTVGAGLHGFLVEVSVVAVARPSASHTG